MKVVRTVGLEALGWVLVVAGIAALVLPGPGLLMLFAGVAILSQRYTWAEKRVTWLRYHAMRGAAESVETWPRICVSILGVVLLFAAAWLWIADPPPPSWWGLPDAWWLPGGLGTAITQIASGLIAAALLVYSYRRFHGKPEAVAALERDIDRADEAVDRT